MLHMCQNSVRGVRKEEALLELVYKYCKLEKLCIFVVIKYANVQQGGHNEATGVSYCNNVIF